MSNRTVMKRFILTLTVFGLILVLIFISLPYIYKQTESRNFAKLRIKSTLDCTKIPLHCFVRDKNITAITNYIHQGNNLELKDGWGKTALFWALENERNVSFVLLLDGRANSNTTDENLRSLILQAVISGQFALADRLLESGADIDILNGADFPETALHYCVRHDETECVGYLVKRGANKHLKDAFGYTVFDRIRMHKHISESTAAYLVGEQL